MDNGNFNLTRISQDYSIKSFDCEGKDLNEFLFEDAKHALNENLAITYVLEHNNRTIAYFCLLNDKISLKEVRSDAFSLLQDIFIDTSFNILTSYPAVKIGRLGVDSSFQSKGIGKKIFDYLKLWFLDNNKAGCRFITVDAYQKSLGFYKKMGFEYITDKDSSRGTRLMYFDLQSIKDIQ